MFGSFQIHPHHGYGAAGQSDLSVEMGVRFPADRDCLRTVEGVVRVQIAGAEGGDFRGFSAVHAERREREGDVAVGRGVRHGYGKSSVLYRCGCGDAVRRDDLDRFRTHVRFEHVEHMVGRRADAPVLVRQKERVEVVDQLCHRAEPDFLAVSVEDVERELNISLGIVNNNGDELVREVTTVKE